ncbi:hypothetical protein GCM10010339_77900 [Streptomyces alanosinicus]|uniref:Uncharacterized protein n=1 Tax=Streptomyces alanosinicus TaxID=68171 RepID=A0A918YQL6_9ACTN|nr:hypothetical protein GCM10010339_77900 [Streptomyces alanosinicus]
MGVEKEEATVAGRDDALVHEKGLSAGAGKDTRTTEVRRVLPVFKAAGAVRDLVRHNNAVVILVLPTTSGTGE